MKFGDFSSNLSGINILNFLFKIQTAFAVSALFHDQLLFVLYVFFWKNEYSFVNISRIWVQKV